ncbi:hypothetical protein Enr10x_61110 [Gimesia panareensis]|uniref:Uncharacterized protein n=1 Tax=Gimesia panareensis TaxID=2527978 RepID=A0A518AGF3_9PLAN|nr:hypothetical protein Enr10x_61110 [Gimesia panareensis]QDU53792.1 hypothetical protein Pan110_61860 [Gimesia panareensis]
MFTQSPYLSDIVRICRERPCCIKESPDKWHNLDNYVNLDQLHSLYTLCRAVARSFLSQNLRFWTNYHFF